MTRVSLREAYDNKDVVAQIYAIRDTAESAEDSAEQAVTTANTASDHVDALVPQVEGAVQNANSASASAQASAQTVAGYENRLATVEGVTEDLSGDLNAVTLRVTTAEGQIVTIQGRVTALETADGQNVKLTGEHAIGNYAVLLTGNQTKTGLLELTEVLTRSGVSVGRTAMNITGTSGNCFVFSIRDSSNKSRGGMNHQTIMSGDRATRNILTLQSDDYDTTAQTGAIGDFTLELLPTGRLVIRAGVTTGDGKTASQTIATLQAV